MDQDTSCGSPSPKIIVAGNTFAELKANFDAVYGVELRRIYHEEQNRLFDRMSKKRQRLTIAQDVLDQLATGKIKAKRNAFIDHVFEKGDLQLSEVLEQRSSCDVCALGGMFVCAVKRLDKMTFDDLWETRHYGFGRATVRDTDIFKYLGRCFSENQLKLIETAFESGHGAFRLGDLEKIPEGKAAVRFCATERDPAKRMKKIMRNIVRNGGKFVP